MLKFKFKADSWWVGLIIIAVVIRLILAAFLFHTDLKGHYMEAALTKNGIAAGYEQGVNQQTPLHYPPVIYILYNTHQFINSWMFSPYFEAWLKDGSFLHLENNQNIFRDLLVMKLPIMIFDFLTAFLLILLAPVGKKRLAAALWLLNPFSLYAIYFFGQFDIIAAFLVLTSIYLWHKSKFNISYGVLGLAAAVKVFPLLLLPILLIYDPRSTIKKISGSALFAAVFLICLAPIITSTIALKSVFLSNLTGGLFKASIDLGGGKTLPIFLVVYFSFLGLLAFNFLKRPVIEAAIFIVLAFLLTLNNFHPQWMVWLFPILVILLVKKMIGWAESIIFLISYLGLSILINDKFVALGTLKAINQSFDSLPSIRTVVDKLGLGFQIESILTALLISVTGLFAYQILRPHLNIKALNIPHINLFKISSAWIALLIVFIITAHLPLVYLGKTIDSSKTGDYDRIVLIQNSTISQNILISNNNFNALEIRFKNINLRNKNNLSISISAREGPAIYSGTINAGAIGDDYNLMLKFPTQANSKGQTYTITITQPEPVEAEMELVIPYDGKAVDSHISLNNELINGSLSYSAFTSTGSLFDNLKYSLNSILRKI